MKKLVVNNALSREVANLFGADVKKRTVLEKNKIEFVIDITGREQFFNYFVNRFHLINRVSDC